MRWQRKLLVVLVAVAILGAAIAYFWSQTEETRALMALPEAERVGLYWRTLENLKIICDPAPGRSFRDFCRAQASLVLEFPDCDAACHDIARRHLSLPRP